MGRERSTMQKYLRLYWEIKSLRTEKNLTIHTRNFLCVPGGLERERERERGNLFYGFKILNSSEFLKHLLSILLQ